MPGERSTLEKLTDPNRGRIVAAELGEDHYRLYVGYGGRSPGSKNRHTIFYPDINDPGRSLIARTEVYDPELVTGSAAATLYNAQRRWENWDIASNGEQTDGIGAVLAATGDFRLAQLAYRHEGKENAYTPRITVATQYWTDRPYNPYFYMGKIYGLPSDPEHIRRDLWIPGRDDELPLEPGMGYVLATYDGKGGTGTNLEAPWPIQFGKTLEDGMDLIWNNWDPNTRANLVGKEVNRKTGEMRYLTHSIHPPKA